MRAVALALGEADAVGALLGEPEGEAVLTEPHEIAKTSVESASNFIIGLFILCSLPAWVMTSPSSVWRRDTCLSADFGSVKSYAR